MGAVYINIVFIFVLMFLGYYLTYKGWFNDTVGDAFSKLVLQIALPCNMFLTITRNFTQAEFLELAKGTIVPLVSMLLTFVVSFIYIKVFKVAVSRRGIFSTAFTCSNTIFIGLPINYAIFGSRAIPFALLYYIVNTTLFWTVGIYLIASDNPQFTKEKVQFNPLVALKKIFSPALGGFMLGVTWVLIQLPLPESVTTFLAYLANLTTPLSMFIIGIIVYGVGITKLSLDKEIIGVLVGRYLISPLLVWAVGQFVIVPPLMLSVFIIQAAMPVQNSIPILARSYQADQKFAASSLGYSVLLYLLYIPVLLKIIL